MNAVRKMAYPLEGSYRAFQKAKIHRKIKFGMLAFGFAFLLACFFIQNNIMHFKQFPPQNPLIKVRSSPSCLFTYRLFTHCILYG
jgi:hypothetical protein